MGDVGFLRTEMDYIDVGQYAYPALVDWGREGFSDVVVSNIGGELLLFRNLCRKGEVVFGEGEVIEGIEPLMYPCATFVDWNNNGKQDMVLGHREGTVILYMNVGSGNEPRFERGGLARHADGRAVDVGLLSHPCVVDWNNDGKKDLVVGNDPGEVILFLNVGTDSEPVFGEGQRLKDGGGELIMGVHSVFTMADLRGTGKCDLLVGHEDERLRLFGNVGTAEEPAFDDYVEIEDVTVNAEKLAKDDPEARQYWELDGLQFDTEYLGNLAPCVVDWRNRGKLDLLVGNYTGLIYLFESVGEVGQLRFGEGTPLRMGERLLRVAGFATPVVCDWNDDGKKDLVVGDLLGRIHVFLNVGSDGEPVFAEDELVSVGGEPIALGPRAIVEVADLDGDGLDDLIVGNRQGGVYALLNVGSRGEPRFEGVEQLRDKSMIWWQLYSGLECGADLRMWEPVYEGFPRAGQARPMNMVETSCPRVVDIDNDGKGELLISHRYGRVFVYDEIPHHR